MLALLVKKRSLKLKSGAAGLKPAGCDVSLQTSVPVTKEDLNRLLGHSQTRSQGPESAPRTTPERMSGARLIEAGLPAGLHLGWGRFC
jgi:hypothetical protein